LQPPPAARWPEVRIVQDEPKAEPLDPLARVDFGGIKNGAAIKAMLIREGWSPDMLAKAEVEDLVQYPGIGEKTAEKIVSAVRRAR